mmetsp:Transcript_6304/g.39261  ORF Transcript_6304/g.39261 Transcript_6304/m.39261 type:complete len:210 (+) Transcript_6304:1830-2459(+)
MAALPLRRSASGRWKRFTQAHQGIMPVSKLTGSSLLHAAGYFSKIARRFTSASMTVSQSVFPSLPMNWFKSQFPSTHLGSEKTIDSVSAASFTMGTVPCDATVPGDFPMAAAPSKVPPLCRGDGLRCFSDPAATSCATATIRLDLFLVRARASTFPRQPPSSSSRLVHMLRSGAPRRVPARSPGLAAEDVHWLGVRMCSHGPKYKSQAS